MKHLLVLLLLVSVNGFGQWKLTGKEKTTTPSVSFTLPESANKVFNNQSGYDTVQGWVMYYRRVFQYIGFGYFPCLLYYGDSATAIYRKAEGNEHWGSIHQYNPEHGYLVQILVDGKEFDIRKKYEFIDDKDVVKKKLRVLNDK